MAGANQIALKSRDRVPQVEQLPITVRSDFGIIYNKGE
jgi:hypothetical protein